MKNPAFSLLLALLVLSAQAGSPLSQAMCQTKRSACCCTPNKAAPSDCHAPKKADPCPMMTQVSSGESAVLPSKFSLDPQLALAGSLALPTDVTLTPSMRIASNQPLAPPGPSPHRRPSLRAPPALA